MQRDTNSISLFYFRGEKMVDRLLRHPVPYKNESIGNYVLRLCSENSCKINQVTELIGLKWKSIENFYIKLKEENINKFSELTGIDVKVIEDMTLSRFRFQDHIDYRNCTEACVCPKCYSEISYERIHWKNKLIKVCIDHEIYLVDECPNCKKGFQVIFFYMVNVIVGYLLMTLNMLNVLMNIYYTTKIYFTKYSILRVVFH
jgi:hypothetical protein